MKVLSHSSCRTRAIFEYLCHLHSYVWQKSHASNLFVSCQDHWTAMFASYQDHWTATCLFATKTTGWQFLLLLLFQLESRRSAALRLRHIERVQSAQFYAPTKASIKEFRLYPVFILRLFVLGKGVGHY